MLPIMLIVGIPIGFTIWCFEYPFRHNRNSMCKSPAKLFWAVILIIICLSIGCVLNIIALPFIIICGCPIALGCMIYERYKMHRRANKNLKNIIEGRS
jgi:hypothetical protein